MNRANAAVDRTYLLDVSGHLLLRTQGEIHCGIVSLVFFENTLLLCKNATTFHCLFVVVFIDT